MYNPDKELWQETEDYARLPFQLHLLVLLRRPRPTIKARIRVPCPRTTLYRHTSIGCPHVDRLRVLLRLGINTNINCSIKTILNRLSDQRNLHDRVVAALFGHVEERVRIVSSDGLCVGVVGGGLFNLVHEGLLDVELTDVRNCATLDGVVGEEFSAVVNDG
jgi:hypothetical protein